MVALAHYVPRFAPLHQSVHLLGLYVCFFFFSSRRRHTRSDRDWSSDVCSSDLPPPRDGASRGGGVAECVPPPRDRISPCADRPAVRHGAPPPRVTFLHPLALLGLAAAGIPALLHLLERRVPPEAEFPPIRYLSEAERQSARRLKLRHLLLLVLRTTLIALIVMAAARPLVRSRGAVGGGAHEPTALALILDNSPSSGAVVDGHPLIERLKTVVRAAISRAAPGDRLWLMLSDGVARAGSRDALLATVDSGVPGWRGVDLTGAVAGARRVVDAEPLPGREVAVVSDLQRTTLGEGRADIPRGVRVLALAPASSGEAPADRGGGAAPVEDGAVGVPGV